MANPLIVNVPKGAWLMVAEGVTTGFVRILKRGVMYQQTYRLTGEADPVDQNEGAELEDPKEEIRSTAAIDVYLFCTSGDGRVRVDV